MDPGDDELLPSALSPQRSATKVESALFPMLGNIKTFHHASKAIFYLLRELATQWKQIEAML